MIEDKERAKRLNEVYRYLYANKGVVSQTLFASQIGVQRSALSAAMNGNKLYLTKNLFMKICAAFPGLFNLDYLLTGEGSLLMLPDKSVLDGMEKFQKEIKRWSESDEVKQMRETMDAMRQTIESYQTAIRAQNELIARLKKELNQSYPNPGIFASDDMVNLTTKPNPKQEK